MSASKEKFGAKKPLKVKAAVMDPEKKEIDADKVRKAARLLSGNAADEDSDSSEEDPPAKQAMAAKPEETAKPSALKRDTRKAKTGAKATAVSFNEQDLSQYDDEKQKLIKDKTLEKETDEAKLLKSIFVTQEEEAYSDFEKDKDQQIEE